MVNIYQAKLQAKDLLIKEEGIVGVGIWKGKIIVYVEEITNEILRKIPLRISGELIYIVESGKFYALQDRRSKWRPAEGGVSIGHYAITSGTLGGIVYDNATNEKLILSNNHVLANTNMGSRGDRIYQPGSHFGGRKEDTIAYLERWVKLKLSNNLVDCAVAKPIDEGDLTDNIFELGSIAGSVKAKEGVVVKKSGARSSYNYGVIQDINASVKVKFSDGEVRLFDDQIITSLVMNGKIHIPMLWGGDSGSLLLNTNNSVVGLGFAGSSSYSIFNKITNVMNDLNIYFSGDPLPEYVKDDEEPLTIKLAILQEGSLKITSIDIPTEANGGDIVNLTIHTQNSGEDDNFKVELSGDLTDSQEFYIEAGATKDVDFSFTMPSTNMTFNVNAYHLE